MNGDIFLLGIRVRVARKGRKENRSRASESSAKFGFAFVRECQSHHRHLFYDNAKIPHIRDDRYSM